MSLQSEATEITGIVNRFCDKVALLVAPVGTQGAEVRRQVGDIRADALKMLADQTFASAVLTCFETLRSFPTTTVERMAWVREALVLEQPIGVIATTLVETLMVLSIGSESILMTQRVFVARDDVDAMIVFAKNAFDQVRDITAEGLDANTYQNVTLLAGKVIAHLATVARPLPRMVTFELAMSYSALSAAHLIYQDASRFEELMAENHTVHPLFMQRSIVGLSA
jgi:prophage DNA circulation protein